MDENGCKLDISERGATQRGARVDPPQSGAQFQDAAADLPEQPPFDPPGTDDPMWR